MNSINPSNERLADPVVLLFQTSPYGTLDAIVQHDGKAVYFYLNQPPSPPDSNRQNSFGTRACWVRNLDQGPLVLDEDEMRQGISPMLPRTYCVHREAQPIPDSDHLHVVWFEEGNGAALIESSPNHAPKTLAVIPPWSGLEEFHGYAAECAIESPLCWPMPDNPRLDQRIEQASQFWQQWDSQSDSPAQSASTTRGDDPFAELQPRILDVYDARFSKPTATASVLNTTPKRKYFSIDGGQFPPRGLAQYESNNEIVLITVGMSVCPQPAVELFTDDPINYRRIELAVRIPIANSSADELTAKQVESVAKQLSGLAGYPWKHLSWFGPGHTCKLSDAAPNCESALLVHDQQLAGENSDRVSMPTFRDDPVNLLWLMPISEVEQMQLQEQTITADEVIAAHRV